MIFWNLEHIWPYRFQISSFGSKTITWSWTSENACLSNLPMWFRNWQVNGEDFEWASLKNDGLEGFPGGAVVKNLPVMQERRETWLWSLGWQDPLEKGMATHSRILAWRIRMDWRAWWAAVHRLAKSWARLKWLSSHRKPLNMMASRGFPGDWGIKSPPGNAEDTDLIPGLGQSPCAAEQLSPAPQLCGRAWEPHLLSPHTLEPVLHVRRRHRSEKPSHRIEERPLLATARGEPTRSR